MGLIIHSNSEPDIVKDYYNFIVDKLKKLNLEEDYSLVGWGKYNAKKEKVIFINYEHNLVHPNLQYQISFIGKIPVIDNKSLHYQIRIEQYKRLFYSNYFFEYSRPNIENIKSSIKLDLFLSKIIYLPPLLCEYSPESENRNEYDVITSFNIMDDVSRPRRKVLHNKLQTEIAKYLNIPKVFGDDLYNHFYQKSKVLINIHQTDYHHTFEELRVLPALLNGLIVIAEDSPLKETIPYHEYIIWTKYENVVETTKNVLEKYEFYYNKIHGGTNLKNLIKQMEHELSQELKNKLKEGKQKNRFRVWFLARYYSLWIELKILKNFILKLLHKCVNT